MYQEEEERRPAPQVPPTGKTRAEELQEDIKDYSKIIKTSSRTITLIGEKLVPLLEKGGQKDLIAELKEQQAKAEAQQAEAKTQLAKAEAELEVELAGIQRPVGPPPRKRLELASSKPNAGQAGFFNTVLMQRPPDFSQAGVIQLGAALFGSSERPSFLINRAFDVGRDLALEFVNNRTSVMVAGSKGIGKSCLGLVIVRTLLEQDQVVAYEYGRTRMLLVPSQVALARFSADEVIEDHFAIGRFDMLSEAGMYVFRCSEEVLLFEELRLSDALVHVVDVGDLTGEVQEDNCQIVISSPNSDKLKRFEALATSMKCVIYPPWTWDEIVLLNASLDPKRKQDDKVLKAKFELFGGVPPLIFKAQTADEAMGYLITEVGEVPLQVWKNVFSAPTYGRIPKLVPGALVAITKSQTIERIIDVDFISDFVRQLVIRRYVTYQRAELLSLLKSAEGKERMMSSLQGYLLEEAMHAALLSRAPREYQLLDLKEASPSNARPVQFPVLRNRAFSRMDMSDISGDFRENDYFRPTFSNFTAVESFAIVRKSVLFSDQQGLCIVGFQATVSPEHIVKRAGLKAIQNKVKMLSGDALDLYIVFVTKQGKGIEKRQKLGEGQHVADLDYLQFVLYGMELGEDFKVGGNGE